MFNFKQALPESTTAGRPLLPRRRHRTATGLLACKSLEFTFWPFDALALLVQLVLLLVVPSNHLMQIHLIFEHLTKAVPLVMLVVKTVWIYKLLERLVQKLLVDSYL